METVGTNEQQGNTILDAAAEACHAEISHSPAGRDVAEMTSALLRKLEPAVGYAGVGEIEDVIGYIYSVHATEMFKRGWELRGNPDLLGKLVQRG